MAKNHYEVLGVSRNANADQIRSAYRKLALKHHPDQSKDPASKAIFLAATESYEALSDPDSRKEYDERLNRQATRASGPKASSASGAATTPRPSPPRPTATKPPGPMKAAADTGSASPKIASIAEEIQRLTKLYQTGRHADSEAKAHEILKRDSRQPMPYAILGDIARARGNTNEAAKMYAYAMQMDPRNLLYERRYREILDRSRVVDDRKRTRLEPADKKVIVPMIGGFIVVLMSIYLVLSQEQPVLREFGPVSTWTFSSLVALFVSGVTVGASLSIGNVVERYGEVSVTSTGRFSPTAALGCVSLIQFWLAAILYGAVGLVHRSWNYSITRLVAGVGAATIAMSFAACLNVSLDPRQIFVWGGNLVYLGALCGWIVADAFR